MAERGDDFYCGWRGTPTGRSCYGSATHAVETTPSRRHLNFACEQHRLHDQWAHQIKVAYQIIALEQWIAEGRATAAARRAPPGGGRLTSRRRKVHMNGGTRVSPNWCVRSKCGNVRPPPQRPETKMPKVDETPTVVCPGCCDRVPHTDVRWDSEAQLCRQCVRSGIGPGGVQIRPAEPAVAVAAPVPPPTRVVLTDIRLSFGAVLEIVFKAAAASLLIGGILGMLLWVLREMISTGGQ